MIQTNRPYLTQNRFFIFIIEIKLNTSIKNDQNDTSCCTTEYLQTFSPILYNLV